MAERDEPDVGLADAPAEARAASADVAAADLAPLRERIDAIDREIVALLNERARIALEIGRVKQVAGRRSVRDARREEQVIEHVTSVSAGLFPEPELVALYRKLIAATRRVQHAQRRQSPSGTATPPGRPAAPGAGHPVGRGRAARPAPDVPPDQR